MENAFIEVDKGKYALQLQALKQNADEPSAMANYLSKTAIVSKEDNTLTLSLLFQSEQTITGFQVENHAGELIEASQKQVNDETERRYELFELKSLPAILNVRVQYEVEHEGRSFTGDEMLRLVFDQATLEKVG